MTDNSKTILLVMGCPKVPAQTSLVLYTAGMIKKRGHQVLIAGTPSADNIIKVADFEGHYTGKILILDKVINDLAEHKLMVDCSYVFVHNDAGVSYAATISALTEKPTTAIIFGENADNLVKEITFPCSVISDPVTHNPMPLKRKIDEVKPWDA